MLATCSTCGHDLRPRARHCGQCGAAVVSSESMFPVVRVAAPRLTPIVAAPDGTEPIVRAQLEMHTRLNPLMNQERLKAMVMAVAANGGTGTVGYWSDC